MENEKILMFIHDQSQNLIQKISEVKVFGEEFVKSRVKGVEDWISLEQNNAAKREYQIKQDFDASLLQMQSSTQHDIQISKEDINLKFDASIKTVQYSVAVLEDSTQSRLEKIEKVMHAEIEQRLEQQLKHEGEVSKLSEQLHQANGKIFELNALHSAETEKLKTRIETVQSNLKQVLHSLTDDVQKNKNTIISLSKSLQDTNLSLLALSASEKETISEQLEKQLQVVNSNIKQLQHSFGDLHTKSAVSEQKALSVATELIALSELKNTVGSLITSVNQIGTWKSAIPDQVVSRRTFEEYVNTNNQSIGDCKSQIKNVSGIITTSNILKTVDVLKEFTKLQAKVQDDQSYIQNIVTKLSQNVDEKVHLDVFNAFKEVTESMISEVQDMHRLTNSDIDNIEQTLKQKVDQNQFQNVDIHVKNLRDSLGSLSTWVQENASKQAKDIHTTLMEVQQGLTSRQLNQFKHVEETKEHLDKKIEQVALNLHDQQQKITHFQDKISNQLLTNSTKTESSLSDIKKNYTQLVKSNGDRVEEVERHIEHLKTTMGAFINEKIIPLATKNELQVIESNIHLLSSEFKQSRDTQRASFDHLKSELDSQSKKLGKSSTDTSSLHESKQLRDSIRTASEQTDQKYAIYLSKIHDMSDRLNLLELKQNSESLNMKFSDTKIQDMNSQLRQLETRVTSGKRSNYESKESLVSVGVRPTSGNIFKPDLNIRSSTNVSEGVKGSRKSMNRSQLSINQEFWGTNATDGGLTGEEEEQKERQVSERSASERSEKE